LFWLLADDKIWSKCCISDRVFDKEADVLVNLIGEDTTLDRASRLSAEFCKVVGRRRLQTVRLSVPHDDCR